jgi:hypothetical protein
MTTAGVEACRSIVQRFAPQKFWLQQKKIWLASGRTERIRDRRFLFLDQVRTARTAVVCGGDGAYLTQLLDMNPLLEADCIGPKTESAAAGLAKSEESGRLRFAGSDIRRFTPRLDGYDLLITNFFLDHFEEAEVEQVTAKMASWAAPRAKWIVSEFQQSESRERWFKRKLIRRLFARWHGAEPPATIPDYTAALTRAGFWLRQECSWLGGLLQSSLWETGPWPGEIRRGHRGIVARES